MEVLKFLIFLMCLLVAIAALLFGLTLAEGGALFAVFFFYFVIFGVPAFTALLFLVLVVFIFIQRQSIAQSDNAGKSRSKRQKLGRVLVPLGVACVVLALVWDVPKFSLLLQETSSSFFWIIAAVLVRDTIPGMFIVLLGYLLQRQWSSKLA
ncbi:MAG: hypothetical protein ACU0GG_19655 [Paracoccaceae bacterium]